MSKHNFLVGVSIDGPDWLHDNYRRDKNNNPTQARVLKGIKLLEKYNVDFNILCVVHDQNSKKPLEVYNFFKEIGAKFIHLFPLLRKIWDVGRNAPCPCGSGKKYKICCLRANNP
ncbi:MAG: uncharacterized protein PWR10_2384 [Halanaerobiales bacterium]|nr:uncharacterized protein [Halanaerobiales bacterium]